MKTKKFVTKKPAQRNYLIDMAKWICMIFVIYQHIGAAAPTYLHEHFWIRFAVAIFLLISGYTQSLSYDKKNINSLHEMYRPSLLLKKFLRLAIPWVVIFIVLTIVNYTIHEQWDWLGFFRHLIMCGYGAGEYFIVVMFQLIILFPLIYYFVNKYKFKGFVGVYIFTIIFELFRWAVNMPSIVYMDISIRYFAFVGFGAYLYVDRLNPFSFKSWKIDIALAISFALGFVYLWFCFENPVLPQTDFFINIAGGGGWMLHSTFLGALYLLPLMYLLFKKVKLNVAWIAYMGRCSYSIFLIQMLIFVVSAFSTNPNGDVIHNFYFLWFLSIVGSFLGGWLYYLLFEKVITGKIVGAYSQYLIKRQSQKKQH